MGFYLSHMNNRKSDLATQRFPDENFAREVMQLFSIGLWELEMDGSRRQDNEGNNIPTYDNSVITELAKVFTGMMAKESEQLMLEFFKNLRKNIYLWALYGWRKYALRCG